MRTSWRVPGLLILGILALGAVSAIGQSANEPGHIVGWGSQIIVGPDDIKGCENVAAGAYHSVGLKSDGTIIAWGANNFGQCDVPTPNADFVAVAAGYAHSLGLKSNGTVVAWGRNADGECDVPAPNGNFVAIAGGESHSLGLKTDGTIVAWGWNGFGQCTVPSPNGNFEAIAAGRNHSLGLKTDGSIVAWGANGSGQTDVLTPNELFAGIAAGATHSMGLKTDGTVVAWGDSTRGQCDVPLATDATTVRDVSGNGNDGVALNGPLWVPGKIGYALEFEGFDDIVDVQENNSLDVRRDLTLDAWINPTVNDRVMTIVAKWDTAYGENRSYLLSIGGRPWDPPVAELSGRVCFILMSDTRQKFTLASRQKVLVDTLTHVVAKFNNSQMSLYINDVLDTTRTVGMTNIWVGDARVQIGGSQAQKTGDVYVPDPMAAGFVGVIDEVRIAGIVGSSPSAEKAYWPLDDGGKSLEFTKIVAGGGHSAGIRPDGSIVVWGADDYLQRTVPEPNQSFVQLAAGYAHTVALNATGTVFAWGWNEYGQCVVPMQGLSFTTLDGGFDHTVALKSDGRATAWGWNYYNQARVPPLSKVITAVSAGGRHNLVLNADRTVAVWGYNAYGQSTLPADNDSFVAVSAGYDHSLALKANGRIVAWGWNGYGQTTVPSPNADFTAVAAGERHSLGLKANGSIVAWGSNSSGQSSVPSPNTGFTAIAAGGWHNLALKADGSIVAWGNNSDGQCNVPSPNSGFVAIAAGGWHSLALKSDGSIVAWGWNERGQCDVPSPNSDFVAIAATYYQSLGIRSGTLTAVQMPGGVPGIAALEILSLSPNPFNPSTKVAFQTSIASDVSMEVFDVAGRRVRSEPLGFLGPGRHFAGWDGRDGSGTRVASGVYFVRLKGTAGASRAVKAVITR